MKLSTTPRSEAGMGFRGAGGERIRNHGQRKLKDRMSDGHLAGSTQQVADMSVAKMVAAINREHLHSKDPRIFRPKGGVILLRNAGNVAPGDQSRKAPQSEVPSLENPGQASGNVPTASS